MIMFQMIWKTSEIRDFLQFRAHLWHPNNADKHLENAGNLSP